MQGPVNMTFILLLLVGSEPGINGG
jgi:hypothetical protein